MASDSQVQVKVIFTREGGSGGKVRVSSGSRRSVGTAALVLAVLNLVLAGAAYYAVWWPVRSKLTQTAALNTPLGPGASAALERLFTRKAPAEPPAGETAAESTESEPEVQAEERPWRFSSLAAQKVIPATLYGWIAVGSIAIALLASSGGAIVGRTLRGGRARLLVVVGLLSLVAAPALAMVVWRIQVQDFDPALVFGTGVAILACTLIGAGLGRGGRLAARIAGAGVVVWALGSVAALWLGNLCYIGPDKVLHPQILSLASAQSPPILLGVVFVLHSLWGWVLLVVSRRLPG